MAWGGEWKGEKVDGGMGGGGWDQVLYRTMETHCAAETGGAGGPGGPAEVFSGRHKNKPVRKGKKTPS